MECNRYSGPSCVKCPKGSYKGLEGPSVCLNCTKDGYEDTLGATACKKCPSGYYTLSNSTPGNETLGNNLCLPCPQGMLCPGNGDQYTIQKSELSSPSSGVPIFVIVIVSVLLVALVIILAFRRRYKSSRRSEKFRASFDNSAYIHGSKGYFDSSLKNTQTLQYDNLRLDFHDEISEESLYGFRQEEPVLYCKPYKSILAKAGSHGDLYEIPLEPSPEFYECPEKELVLHSRPYRTILTKAGIHGDLYEIPLEPFQE
eukprot:UC4_evm1s1557